MENDDSDIDDQMALQSMGYEDTASVHNKFTLSDTKLEANSLFTFINKRNEHIKYNTFMLCFSSLKLLFTIPITIIFPTTCKAPLDIWLAVTCFYDFLKIIARILIIHSILSSRPKKSQIKDSMLTSKDNNGINDLTVQLSNAANTEDDYVPQPSKKKKFAQYLLIACMLLYVGIFVWGQIMYFEEFHQCGNMPDLKKVVFYMNLIVGYIYIGIPCIFISLGLVCFGGLFVATFCCFERIIPKKRKAGKDGLFSSVATEKYTIDFLGGQDCGLCSMDYEIGEEVVRLSCDEKHQFHANCLKKWMEQNINCPLCSVKIKLRRKKMKVKDLKKIAVDILD